MLCLSGNTFIGITIFHNIGDFKLLFREAFIPAYFVDHLLAKVDNLKHGSSTVNEYYHEFKICVIFGSLDECKKDVMSRFMKGLNSEIQTILIHETYSYIGHLFLLAQIAENRFHYLAILA
jgi:hypothetical protein